MRYEILYLPIFTLHSPLSTLPRYTVTPSAWARAEILWST